MAYKLLATVLPDASPLRKAYSESLSDCVRLPVGRIILESDLPHVHSQYKIDGLDADTNNQKDVFFIRFGNSLAHLTHGSGCESSPAVQGVNRCLAPSVVIAFLKAYSFEIPAEILRMQSMHCSGEAGTQTLNLNPFALSGQDFTSPPAGIVVASYVTPKFLALSSAENSVHRLNDRIRESTTREDESILNAIVDNVSAAFSIDVGIRITAFNLFVHSALDGIMDYTDVAKKGFAAAQAFFESVYATEPNIAKHVRLPWLHNSKMSYNHDQVSVDPESTPAFQVDTYLSPTQRVALAKMRHNVSNFTEEPYFDVGIGSVGSFPGNHSFMLNATTKQVSKRNSTVLNSMPQLRLTKKVSFVSGESGTGKIRVLLHHLFTERIRLCSTHTSPVFSLYGDTSVSLTTLVWVPDDDIALWLSEIDALLTHYSASETDIGNNVPWSDLVDIEIPVVVVRSEKDWATSVTRSRLSNPRTAPILLLVASSFFHSGHYCNVLHQILGKQSITGANDEVGSPSSTVLVECETPSPPNSSSIDNDDEEDDEDSYSSANSFPDQDDESVNDDDFDWIERAGIYSEDSEDDDDNFISFDDTARVCDLEARFERWVSALGSSASAGDCVCTLQSFIWNNVVCGSDDEGHQVFARLPCNFIWVLYRYSLHLLKRPQIEVDEEILNYYGFPKNHALATISRAELAKIMCTSAIEVEMDANRIDWISKRPKPVFHLSDYSDREKRIIQRCLLIEFATELVESKTKKGKVKNLIESEAAETAVTAPSTFEEPLQINESDEENEEPTGPDYEIHIDDTGSPVRNHRRHHNMDSNPVRFILHELFPNFEEEHPLGESDGSETHSVENRSRDDIGFDWVANWPTGKRLRRRYGLVCTEMLSRSPLAPTPLSTKLPAPLLDENDHSDMVETIFQTTHNSETLVTELLRMLRFARHLNGITPNRANNDDDDSIDSVTKSLRLIALHSVFLSPQTCELYPLTSARKYFSVTTPLSLSDWVICAAIQKAIVSQQVATNAKPCEHSTFVTCPCKAAESEAAIRIASEHGIANWTFTERVRLLHLCWTAKQLITTKVILSDFCVDALAASTKLSQESSTQPCDICFDAPVNVFLACGHFMCRECILRHLRTDRDESPKCPFCNVKIRRGSINMIITSQDVSNPQAGFTPSSLEEFKRDLDLQVSYTNQKMVPHTSSSSCTSDGEYDLKERIVLDRLSYALTGKIRNIIALISNLAAQSRQGGRPPIIAVCSYWLHPLSMVQTFGTIFSAFHTDKSLETRQARKIIFFNTADARFPLTSGENMDIAQCLLVCTNKDYKVKNSVTKMNFAPGTFSDILFCHPPTTGACEVSHDSLIQHLDPAPWHDSSNFRHATVHYAIANHPIEMEFHTSKS